MFEAKTWIQVRKAISGGQLNATSWGVEAKAFAPRMVVFVLDFIQYGLGQLIHLIPLGKSARSRPIGFSLVPRWFG